LNGSGIDLFIGITIFKFGKMAIVLHHPNKTLVEPHTNNGSDNWTDDRYPKEVVLYTKYLIPTIDKCSKKTWTEITSLSIKNKENNTLQINIYKLHTGLIAAPALSENAQIMPVTISANANGVAAFDII
jgi:hypothetical protein